MGTDRIEMNAYQDTIAAVRKLLQDNPEWIARYKGYIDTFAEKKAAGKVFPGAAAVCCSCTVSAISVFVYGDS